MRAVIICLFSDGVEGTLVDADPFVSCSRAIVNVGVRSVSMTDLEMEGMMEWIEADREGSKEWRSFWVGDVSSSISQLRKKSNLVFGPQLVYLKLYL